MDARAWWIIFLILIPASIDARKLSREERKSRDLGRGIHYHSKRHMLLNEPEVKKRATTKRTREAKKKPSGHLAPLDEDDMDNDEVVSVAIGPPPIRPKYDKGNWKHPPKPTNQPTPSVTNFTAINLVKDILSQLGRELISRQVSEDFVFGQFVGNAMSNLTSELRLKMQHEILELVVKYQNLNRGDVVKTEDKNANLLIKDVKVDKRLQTNDTDETWPDFSNLANIVG